MSSSSDAPPKRQTSTSAGRALAAVVLGGLFMGCDAPTSVLDVIELEPFEPPSQYVQWWHEVMTCTGLEGAFDEIRWFVGDRVRLDGKDAFGVWSEPHTIYMKRFYATSTTAVKHEMLHELTTGAMPHEHRAFSECTKSLAADVVSISR